jgi:hypothetical protein
MKLFKTLALVPLVVMLGNCDQKPAGTGPSAYAFDVKLEITPEAAALMQARQSHFVAAAFYFGRPKPETRAQANPQGRIKLGYEQIGLAQGATSAHLPAADIDTSLLGAINGEPQVMLNIFSAGEVGARDDLVRCKTYFGIISSAQAQTPVLACDVQKP